jgi:hypothetical protein
MTATRASLTFFITNLPPLLGYLRFQGTDKGRYYLTNHNLASEKSASTGTAGERGFLFCHIVPDCIIIKVIASGFLSIYGSMLRTSGKKRRGWDQNSLDLRREISGQLFVMGANFDGN